MQASMMSPVRLGAVTIAALALTMMSSPAMSLGLGQADYVDLDPPDDTAYCGVDIRAESWKLNVAVSNGGSTEATLRFEVQDGTGTTFVVPAGTSFSFSADLGGVPELDQLVRLTGTGDSADFNGMATALARVVITDPFDGDGETDNVCVSIAAEGPVTTTFPVPDNWVVDGDGSDGGTLQ